MRLLVSPRCRRSRSGRSAIAARRCRSARGCSTGAPRTGPARVPWHAAVGQPDIGPRLRAAPAAHLGRRRQRHGRQRPRQLEQGACGSPGSRRCGPAARRRPRDDRSAPGSARSPRARRCRGSAAAASAMPAQAPISSRKRLRAAGHRRDPAIIGRGDQLAQRCPLDHQHPVAGAADRVGQRQPGHPAADDDQVVALAGLAPHHASLAGTRDRPDVPNEWRSPAIAGSGATAVRDRNVAVGRIAGWHAPCSELSARHGTPSAPGDMRAGEPPSSVASWRSGAVSTCGGVCRVAVWPERRGLTHRSARPTDARKGKPFRAFFCCRPS